MSDILPDRCRSVRQAAHFWQTSPKHVRDLIRRGLLVAFDLGGRRKCLRITPEAMRDCERLLAAGGRPARRRREPSGISPTVAALLNGDV